MLAVSSDIYLGRRFLVCSGPLKMLRFACSAVGVFSPESYKKKGRRPFFVDGETYRLELLYSN